MSAHCQANSRELHRPNNGTETAARLPEGVEIRPWTVRGVGEFGWRASRDHRDYVLGCVYEEERRRRLRREEQRALREAKRGKRRIIG